MNRGIYSTAAAMHGAQRQLDVLANNLANVGTAGYKRDELAFGQTLEVRLRANGGSGADLGTISLGTAGESAYVAMEIGPIMETSSPYDFAINQKKGMFAVQTPQGLRYTRNGSFELGADGTLLTRDKYPVLDAGGNPIQIPLGSLNVQDDGTLMVDGRTIGNLAIFDGHFIKQGEGLYTGSQTSPIEEPSFRWKALESSNVNAVASMVEMIQLQRRFDLAQRSISQQDELAQRLIQSLSQS